MDHPNRLSPEQLYRVCDASQIGFDTTADFHETPGIVGQARAVEAIRFGVGIRHEGYNLYALGPSGTGKRSVTEDYIRRQAATEAVPSDWCYVNNFAMPHRPRALALPAGRGRVLQRDMAQLVEELGGVVPAVFESDEYHAREQEIEEAYKERQEKAFQELQKEAEAADVAMLRTPAGLAFAPLRKGEIIKPEAFAKLSKKEQERIEQVIAALQERLEGIIQQIPRWRREMQQEIKKLNRDVVMSAVGQLISEIKKTYADLPAVLEYLDMVQQDVIDHADQFRVQEEAVPAIPGMAGRELMQKASTLQRYQVNVMVDHTRAEGAPVVYADHPTFTNLVGRIEHQAELGALVTNFTLIKPGALHRANGGYLILDAREMLMQPYAWEGIKRALKSKEIRMESLGQALSLISTVSLEPDPIPLDVKVVMLGERFLYYLLCEYDPDFAELFKVAVDFDERMPRGGEHDRHYAELIALLARRESIRPLDRQAVARVIEHGARMIEDAERLSTRFGKVVDLLREADHWAGEAGRELIRAEDVERAIEARRYRHGRLAERYREEIERGILLIASEGARVGQVNGLSVIQLGEQAFGHPSRITARVRLGKGEVVDIEREVELGGPIHSKGVLILSGFLSGRYVPDRPLSLSASLVFEQTYGGVEGDSASSAELYALLSALAEAPLKQSLAVTGSVNQHGEVQAIGGVNEKIEGFFEVCQARGLNGEHGVIIPAVNARHLMLRKPVVEAVAAGRFHIYAVDTIDQGMELLTGLPAGERDEAGQYPEGSINQKVEARLIALAEQARHHEGEGEGEAH